jgi:predicted acyltransferase
LFVFIAGVSSVWSLNKEREKHGRAGAARRVIRRGLLLVLLGIVYSGGLSAEWPNIRLLGVLQRIGLAYLFAGLMFLWCKPRALAGICLGLLVGYWALMSFVPIRDIQLDTTNLARRAAHLHNAATAALFDPGVNPSTVKNSLAWAAAEKMFGETTERVTGKFDKGFNLSNHFDFQFLPGKKYDSYWDPEGILSTLPAIATCLLGVFAGLLLRNSNFSGQRKTIYLVVLGLSGALLGFLWGMQFPVVKKIWTSSFVLMAGGLSAMLLAAFYFVVDVRKYRKWCQPFVWIGMNSITVYLANNIVGFRRLAERFVGGDVKGFLETRLAKGIGDLALTVTGLGLGVLLCWFLHRKRIFLRL